MRTSRVLVVAVTATPGAACSTSGQPVGDLVVADPRRPRPPRRRASPSRDPDVRSPDAHADLREPVDHRWAPPCSRFLARGRRGTASAAPGAHNTTVEPVWEKFTKIPGLGFVIAVPTKYTVDGLDIQCRTWPNTGAVLVVAAVLRTRSPATSCSPTVAASRSPTGARTAGPVPRTRPPRSPSGAWLDQGRRHAAVGQGRAVTPTRPWPPWATAHRPAVGGRPDGPDGPPGRSPYC